MIVLDAYALIGYLRGEGCADEVRALLADACVVSALNVAEIIDLMSRVFGHPADDIRASLALLSAEAGLQVASVDETTAARAGRLRATHYGSKSCPVSMADCVAAATAQLRSATLATSDPDLARLARLEGIEVIALSDSTGRRP